MQPIPWPELFPSFILQELQDLRRPLRIFLEQPEIDVRAVGVVVHGEDLLADPPG